VKIDDLWQVIEVKNGELLKFRYLGDFHGVLEIFFLGEVYFIGNGEFSFSTSVVCFKPLEGIVITELIKLIEFTERN
jgi:hypothetical protein